MSAHASNTEHGGAINGSLASTTSAIGSGSLEPACAVGRTPAKLSREDLKFCGIAARAVYVVASEVALLGRRSDTVKDFALERLTQLVPNGPFDYDCHAGTAVKLINPKGHGANSARFQRVELFWFRRTYPGERRLTDGLTMFICACLWWTEQQGKRSIQGVSPLTTADFDKKLKALGFLQGERKALCTILRYQPRR